MANARTVKGAETAGAGSGVTVRGQNSSQTEATDQTWPGRAPFGVRDRDRPEPAQYLGQLLDAGLLTIPLQLHPPPDC